MWCRSIAPGALALFLALMGAETWAATEAEKLLWANDIAQALEVARADAEARPDDLAAQELFLDILVSTGRVAEAVRLVGARLGSSPEDADVHYLMGRVQPDPREARQSYEQSLRLVPEHARAFMGMGALHLAQGRADDAAAAYGRASQLDPSLSEAWLGLVRARAQQGDAHGATEAAREAVRHTPDEGGAYLALAQLRPEQGVEVLKRGAEAVPHDPRVHEALAEALLDAGEVGGARAAAERALSIDARLADAQRVVLVATEVSQGRLTTAAWKEMKAMPSESTSALPGWDALVAAHPRSVVAWMGRAAARQATSLEGAIEDLLQAEKLAPEEPEVAGALGVALVAGERGLEARPRLRKATTARPWDVSLRLAMARAHTQAGDPQAAVLELSQLAKDQPHDVRVTLTYAQALADAGRPGEGYRLVKVALTRQADPRLAAGLVMLAPAAGKHREAADFLEQLARQAGSDSLLELSRKLRAAAD